MLAGQANNTEVPICLAYDQTHYEPLLPDTEDQRALVHYDEESCNLEPNTNCLNHCVLTMI